MEPRHIGLLLATGVVVYKVCIYANAKYRIKKDKEANKEQKMDNK